jgi:hypothetical protein
MTPQERIKVLVEALNEFVAEGNNDVPEKMQKDYTKLMQTAHSLAFNAVDVTTRMDAANFDENSEFAGATEKGSEKMGRFAKVIELHETKRASLR